MVGTHFNRSAAAGASSVTALGATPDQCASRHVWPVYVLEILA
jgi:hypothetical protein